MDKKRELEFLETEEVLKNCESENKAKRTKTKRTIILKTEDDSSIFKFEIKNDKIIGITQTDEGVERVHDLSIVNTDLYYDLYMLQGSTYSEYQFPDDVSFDEFYELLYNMPIPNSIVLISEEVCECEKEHECRIGIKYQVVKDFTQQENVTFEDLISFISYKVHSSLKFPTCKAITDHLKRGWFYRHFEQDAFVLRKFDSGEGRAFKVGDCQGENQIFTPEYKDGISYLWFYFSRS